MSSRKQEQKALRKQFVKKIVGRMSKRLASKKHQKRMVTTNRLLPLGGLRRQCIKKIFGGVVLDFIGQGRVLTKTLAKEVAHRLRRKFELPVCEGDHRNDEVNRIHVLLKGARKRKIGGQKPKLAMAGSSMDNLDTVPLLSEEQVAEIWKEPGGKIGCIEFGLVYICNHICHHRCEPKANVQP